MPLGGGGVPAVQVPRPPPPPVRGRKRPFSAVGAGVVPGPKRMAPAGGRSLFRRGLAPPPPAAATTAPVARTLKAMPPIQAVSTEEAAEWLLERWGLQEDVAVKYSLSSASVEELQALIDADYAPMADRRRTSAEQVNNRLIQDRERLGPGGGALDAIEVFSRKWALPQDEVAFMRSLSHKELRHVIRCFDGGAAGARSVGVRDLALEAKAIEPLEAMLEESAPDAPGCATLGRFIRLEITDPLGDALVLGDANLSFSLLLAQHRKGIGHIGGMVATTFESIDQLRERYVEIDSTIQELHQLGCDVLHGVDCTRLAVDERFHGFEERFGAVYYNFPHAGAVRGFFDAHPFVRWRHGNLMQFFFRALRAFMKPGGWVKVSSNSNAQGVRYSDIIGAATLNEFSHVETVPFQQWCLRRYNRSFGDKRDARKRLEGESSYTAQRADKDMVYAFRFAPTGVQPARSPIQRPPSCRDLLTATCACKCGFICPSEMKMSEMTKHHFKTGQHEELEGKDKQLAVAELYKRFLSEVSGRHVG
eukprot:TRINITY_DN64734_c0_g1_i1.p1 TRINITY_DN64734_c0_g1~~TRINITY_DN64734_c0_g1_i1.p1  ORF type:complete len:534 (-),score=137.68 TRINITY_DN64734_c0_g1_i1:103-1704(-)